MQRTIQNSLLFWIIVMMLWNHTAYAENEVRIACIARSNTERYWQDAVTGANDAANALGASVFSIYADLGNDPSGASMTLVKALDIARITDVDAIVVQGRASSEFVERIKAIQQNGTKVVFWDCDADPALRDAYVGIDNYRAGMDLAQVLMARTQKGAVLFPSSVLTGQNFIDRRDGLLDAFIQAEVECIYLEVDQFKSINRDSEYEQYLKSRADIVGLIGNNENTTMKHAQMIVRNGWQDRITLVGFDGTDTLLTYLSQGIISALVLQNSYEMGYKSVECAYKLVQGEPLSETAGQVKYQIIMRE